MKAKTAKLIAALQVELAAAVATKEAASEAMDQKLFDAAVIRISDIEFDIKWAYQGKSKACSITRELVSQNVD